MKNKERKVLQGKLIAGVEKVIQDQHVVLTSKSEKSLLNILKKIAKKAQEEKGALPTAKHAKLNSPKSQPTPVVRVPKAKKKRNR